MSIEINFALDDQDIQYFRDVMERAQTEAGELSDQEIIDTARKVLQNTDASRAPLFVRQRLERLGTMVAMVEDPEWPLESEERHDVVSALAYFHNPSDLISDDVPVLGLIDDAIMIELVARELKHQLEAYDDFCAFRTEQERHDHEGSREDWLQHKQQELLNRMRQRIGRRSSSMPRGTTRLTRFSFLR